MPRPNIEEFGIIAASGSQFGVFGLRCSQSGNTPWLHIGSGFPVRPTSCKVLLASGNVVNATLRCT